MAAKALLMMACIAPGIFLGSQSVYAQSPEMRGEALLESHCAMCHAVGRAGSSPNPQARPLRTLDNTYLSGPLEESLRGGAIIGHPMMPAFKLTTGDARAIVRYLQSIHER